MSENNVNLNKKNLAIVLCESTEKIFQEIKQKKSLDIKNYNSIKNELNKVKIFFDLTEDLSVIILCYFFEKKISNSRTSVCFNEINKYFNCSLIDSILINEQLDILKKNKLINLSRKGFRKNDEYEYSLSLNAFKSILHGDKSLIQNKKEQSFLGFLNIVYELIQEDEFEEADDFNDKLNGLIFEYESLPEVTLLKNLGLNNEELSILLYVLYRQEILGDHKITVERVLRSTISDSFSRYYYENQFLEKNTPLLSKEILEYTPDSFMSHIRITSKILNDLNFKNDKKRNNYVPSHLVKIIMPEETKIQEMIYPDDLNIDFLDKILSNDGYLKSMEKLKSEEIQQKQLVCLLYGSSGTGKSQTIKNLAAKYQRPLIQVSLSQIKDPFVGMTERNMSECFQNYIQAIKHFEVFEDINGNKKGPICGTPIFYIDEFESLVPKRSESGSNSSVQNMYQNLVNVFLTEIESLPSGIVLLSSNIPNAMDVALHRRIHFKFSFGKFSKEEQVKTFKIYFTDFDESFFKEIVESIDLTPGNIVNIKRAYILETLFIEPKTQKEKQSIIKNIVSRETILNLNNTRTIIGFKK